ncbi:DUF4386 domain-containing protein [Longispora sp. NPDC051575]|uniref:DUF4386 domain-containing protein n=1 Tax=Longispora sp. NPDC051575 TaxID=3154943 RepID=UPI003431EC84
MRPQRLARIAGLFYLIVGVFAGFAFYGRSEVYVPGDAATTARNVAEHAGLVRASFVADLVQATFFLFLAMALYVLLKHVHRLVARAMVVFVAVAVGMMCLNMVYQYAALTIATDSSRADALGRPGADALVLLMFDLHGYGFLVAQIFFGMWLLPLGYLVYRSGMLPRALAVLCVVGGVGYLVDLLARFSDPDLGAVLSPFLITPAAVAEISMVLWLLIKGVKTPGPSLESAPV